MERQCRVLAVHPESSKSEVLNSRVLVVKVFTSGVAVMYRANRKCAIPRVDFRTLEVMPGRRLVTE